MTTIWQHCSQASCEQYTSRAPFTGGPITWLTPQDVGAWIPNFYRKQKSKHFRLPSLVTDAFVYGRSTDAPFLWWSKLFTHYKYLGIVVDAELSDGKDIERERRYQYCAANKLGASNAVKNLYFHSFCTSMYASQSWCEFKTSHIQQLRVAYNFGCRALYRSVTRGGAGRRSPPWKFFSLPWKNVLDIV